MKRNPADQHETTIWRNQTDTLTWLAVIVSLPTLLGYQRASAFVNATKLASQPLFSSDEEYKISNVLSNTFFIDIDHVSIAIHIVIVLSPSPNLDAFFFNIDASRAARYIACDSHAHLVSKDGPVI